MYHLLRIIYAALLVTTASRVVAQSQEPIVYAIEQPTAPPPVDEVDPVAASQIDATPAGAPASGPHVRIRLRPVRISMKDFLDRVTIADVLDLLSRL